MANQIKINETEFSVGDRISVQQKIQEADKTRLQSFEGIVINVPLSKAFFY